MHKVLAEIIAGCIPEKMARNQWRGILRYGLLRALRLKRRLKHDATSPTIPLAICAIAKDEGPYIKEWADWHLSKGVDKIYFYDNDSTDNTRQILDPYIKQGVVEYIPWPGHRRQLAAYDDCLERHRLDTRWIAFIDLDEFIVPVKHSSIPHFLAGFQDAAAVEINWLIYGSSGEKEMRPGSVMQRFKRHSLPGHRLNRHVKSIVNPRKVYTMIGCHEVARICGKTFDSHGEEVTKHFRDREPQQDVIKINHYAVKSLQEFGDKQKRGRASGTQRTVQDEYFRQYDLNDIQE